MLVNFNKVKLLYYIILIPFLYPKGFSEYFGWYKNFFTVWLGFSAICIFAMLVIDILNNVSHYKKCLLWVFLYHIVLIFITIFIQRGINEGLQKMFIAPIFCLFCLIGLKNNNKIFVDCLSDILIMLFFLNLTVFNPMFMSSYFSVDSHIIFLGHVQIVAQLGFLGILLSYIIGAVYRNKSKSRCLFLLSIINMVFSRTAASLIVLLVLVCYFFLKQIKLSKFVFVHTPETMVGWFIILNAMLFTYILIVDGSYNFYGLDLSLNGRGFIYSEIFNLLKDHWLIGYGAFGASIKVFWHGNSRGMNYAHNEMLQLLLDGGIILLVIFIIMLYTYIKPVKNITNKSLRTFTTMCIFAFYLIMQIESVTEYYYFFVFLSIITYLPEIEKSVL